MNIECSLCLLEHMALFKASHSITQVKHFFFPLYSDGSRYTIDGLYLSVSAAFTFDLLLLNTNFHLICFMFFNFKEFLIKITCEKH